MIHRSHTQASPRFTEQGSPGSSSKPPLEEMQTQLFKIQVA